MSYCCNFNGDVETITYCSIAFYNIKQYRGNNVKGIIMLFVTRTSWAKFVGRE